MGRLPLVLPPDDDFDTDPWLYYTYGKRYRVVRRPGRVSVGEGFTALTRPHFAIPCRAGVDIVQFGSSEPRELVVHVQNNPELIHRLEPYVSAPEWLEKCKRGECDERARMWWPCDPDDTACVRSGALVFPVQDFPAVAAILQPLPR
jgi:hypothetical protein